MVTIRTLGRIALLLLGSTFLWLTPMFASRDVSTTGALWAVTGDLSYVTIVGFCVVDLVSITAANSTATLIAVNAGPIAAAVPVVMRYTSTLSTWATTHARPADGGQDEW